MIAQLLFDLFGGYKGGKKMAFKWGLTVMMNAPTPNLSATLDLLVMHDGSF
jgi:hypothetical protein